MVPCQPIRLRAIPLCRAVDPDSLTGTHGPVMSPLDLRSLYTTQSYVPDSSHQGIEPFWAAGDL